MYAPTVYPGAYAMSNLCRTNVVAILNGRSLSFTCGVAYDFSFFVASS